MEVTMHRFVLAEFNTHRVFSRNSASSRAIPVEKRLHDFTYAPAWPVSLPSEIPGMQGGVELTGQAFLDAKAIALSPDGGTLYVLTGDGLLAVDPLQAR